MCRYIIVDKINQRTFQKQPLNLWSKILVADVLPEGRRKYSPKKHSFIKCKVSEETFWHIKDRGKLQVYGPWGINLWFLVICIWAIVHTWLKHWCYLHSVHLRRKKCTSTRALCFGLSSNPVDFREFLLRFCPLFGFVFIFDLTGSLEHYSMNTLGEVIEV